MTTYADALVHHIERSIRRDLGLAPVEMDGDGDFGTVVGATVVWVRPMLHRDPPLVRVWTQAVRGVKKSAALLTELNDLNLGLDQVRCILHQGVVLVAAEVEIESLEPGRLGRLVTHVGGNAEHVGRLIAAVYGGEVLTFTESDEEPAEFE